MAPQWMSHVSRIEVLHHVSFINMTHVKSLWNCWSIKIYSWTLSWAMLSYIFINSHSQVSDPGPKMLSYIFINSHSQVSDPGPKMLSYIFINSHSQVNDPGPKMLPYIFINSHSQVRDPGPYGPLVVEKLLLFILTHLAFRANGNKLWYIGQ